MDLKKVEGDQNWPRPKKVKEVQAFLGFANFYRRFLKDFAKIATPLNRLTQKDQEWKWDEDEELAFNDLKKRITSEPIPLNPSELKLTLRALLLEASSVFWRMIKSGIPAPSFPSLSMKSNKITRSMTAKCSLSCVALRIGVITWKVLRSVLRFFQITRTCNTS